jgi:aldose 1-epimerase
MDEKVTHVNMTNHTYWNLSGDFKESTIKEHKLELESNSYCVLDKWLCPTGEIRSVKE